MHKVKSLVYMLKQLQSSSATLTLGFTPSLTLRLQVSSVINEWSVPLHTQKLWQRLDANCSCRSAGMSDEVQRHCFRCNCESLLKKKKLKSVPVGVFGRSQIDRVRPWRPFFLLPIMMLGSKQSGMSMGSLHTVHQADCTGCKTKLLERLIVCLAGLFNGLVGGKREVIVGDAQAG